jgi:hypothetical protein
VRYTAVAVVAAMTLVHITASAGVLRNGVLTVNGKPFYPLGSWNSTYTRPADIARLGMNTCYWSCSDPSATGVASVRQRMRACRGLGLQLVAYVTPGPIETGWTDAQARSFATLAHEPNLLAWYVGDDIGESQLRAMQATVTNLRRHAPGMPAVADFIGKESPEAAETYRRYVDIRCCYDYPVPGKPIREYMGQFEKYRAFAGDPMWTWVQNFMWGSTALRYNLGTEGAGPIPDPEQVRLLAHAAINRGVRGLLFFSHNQLHRLPEISAEVALTCREVALFNDQLAAGTFTADLPASDPNVNVAAYRNGTSTVLSAMVNRPQYDRWIDEAVVRNVNVDCPWRRSSPLPHALLVATPDVVSCHVARLPGRDALRVTLPSLDVCGFVLLTTDVRQAAALPGRVRAVAAALAGLAPGAAAAQTRKVAGAWWQVGLTEVDTEDSTLPAARLADASGDAGARGDSTAAVRYWRQALRASRRVITELMTAIESRRDAVPENQRYLLDNPYALHNLPAIGRAPSRDQPWRYVTRYAVTGPFPLEYGGDEKAPPAAGFVRAYPPETAGSGSDGFETVDGPAHWKEATTLVSGMLNFKTSFRTADNVVAYARATVIASRDMELTLGIGSNDGARVMVNGEQVYTWWGGRVARQNENQVKVKLRKGTNTILAKVANLGGEWQLYLAFSDPARELVFGM